MTSIENVPIIEVTSKNVKRLWPKVIQNVSQSSFIAIDAEMSGLGSTKKTMTSNINDRYAAISSYASSRSIISLGIACFAFSSGPNQADTLPRTNGDQRDEAKQGEPGIIEYNVTVYNIMLLCSEPYTIDPSAVEFLVSHGFNFNKQFSEGISYYKGNDRPENNISELNMRHLFSEIICRRKPLVVHNGLADLVFLYQNFYADCPSKLTALMADYSEIFPSGIYDTKYLAEFFDHTSASFLLYLYKFSFLKNKELHKQRKVSLHVVFDKINEDAMSVSLCEPEESSLENICEKYAAYGWCVQGILCKKSHNINAIIKMHRKKSSKKRKRKTNCSELSNNQVSPTNKSCKHDGNASVTSKFYNTTDEHTVNLICKDDSENTASCKNNDEDQVLQSEVGSFGIDTAINKNNGSTVENVPACNGHRSGVDAFMTGYTFAVFIVSRYKADEAVDADASIYEQYSDAIPFLSLDLKKSVINKLYLSGKSIPLQICKSNFTKTSKNHNEKIVKVYLN